MKKIIPVFFIVTLITSLTAAFSEVDNSSSLDNPSFIDKLDSFSKSEDKKCHL